MVGDSGAISAQLGAPVQAAHYLVETLLSEEAVTAAIGSVYEGRTHQRTRTEDPQEGPFQAARRGAKNHRYRHSPAPGLERSTADMCRALRPEVVYWPWSSSAISANELSPWDRRHLYNSHLWNYKT